MTFLGAVAVTYTGLRVVTTGVGEGAAVTASGRVWVSTRTGRKAPQAMGATSVARARMTRARRLALVLTMILLYLVRLRPYTAHAQNFVCDFV